MAGKHIILGTAGHVDHGKTVLVRQLTGIDTDTLAEEKRRGLSLNLGFAFMDLPGGDRIGLIDVPGHRRFVSNMLAGAAGVDGALLVVAADDSVMPQTREHLYILRLLGVRDGIVIITKRDLVDDEMIEIVREEVSELVAGSFLESSPVVAVSAQEGTGMEDLRREIALLAESLPERRSTAYYRLPVDRAFAIEGAGLVVTGTLFSGRIEAGQEVTIMPAMTQARVRSIEVHGERVDEARFGSRTALNLVTPSKREVPRRGDVICDPRYARPTRLLDCRLEVTDRKAKALASGSEITFHAGTADVRARVRAISPAKGIPPGGEGLAQIELGEEVVAVRADRFVVRQAGVTIGGGAVIDAHPRRHRGGRREEVAGRLEILAKGRIEDALAWELEKASPYVTMNELSRDLGEPGDRLRTFAERLFEAGSARIYPLGRRTAVIGEGKVEWLRRQVMSLMGASGSEGGLVHRRLTRAELMGEVADRAGREMPPELLDAVLEELVASGRAAVIGETYTVESGGPKLTGRAGRVHDALVEAYRSAGCAMPDAEAVARAADANVADVDEMTAYMVEQRELVEVDRGIALWPETVAAAKEKLVGHIREHGGITVSDFRKMVATSRKYALPLIQYFDREGVTVRDGDLRRLPE